jgi:hypothetical protein
MAQSAFEGKKWFAAALAVVLVLALVLAGWLERNRLLAWYYVHCLARADDAARGVWVARTAGLTEKALPRVLECLGQDDARACANAQAVLARWAEQWEPNDRRRAALAARLADLFPSLSSAGQRSALELEALLVRPSSGANPAPLTFAPATARLLEEAVRVPDKEVRRRTLALAKQVADLPDPKELTGSCREVIRAGLRDQDLDNRLVAIQLACQPGINLLEQVVGLLRDEVPEVRRAALLAVGPVPDVIATDDLLHWLHDQDATVRRLCETALRGRGLRDDQIELGRLMTAPEAKTRLQVLERLRRAQDLEPGIWLRRLSHDPAAAVRAAAVRTASELPQVDLSDRMEQIARSDPSHTVRQLARYYLDCRNGRQR